MRRMTIAVLFLLMVLAAPAAAQTEQSSGQQSSSGSSSSSSSSSTSSGGQPQAQPTPAPASSQEQSLPPVAPEPHSTPVVEVDGEDVPSNPISDQVEDPVEDERPERPSSGRSNPRPRFVNFDQNARKWGKRKFCGKAMRSSWCGATVLAMVGSTLTGDDIMPTKVAARWCGTVVNGSVSWYNGSRDTISAAGRNMGLSVSRVGTRAGGFKRIRTALRDGGLAIMSFGAGHFTGNGHYIVIKRYSQGKFYLADPNGRGRNGDSESRGFTESFLRSEGAYMAWTFYA